MHATCTPLLEVRKGCQTLGLALHVCVPLGIKPGSPPTTLAESSFHSGSAFWDNRHTQTHGGAPVSEVLTSCDYRPVPPCPAVCLWSEPAPRRNFDLTPWTRRNRSHYVSWSGRAHGHHSSSCAGPKGTDTGHGLFEAAVVIGAETSPQRSVPSSELKSLR